MHDDTPHLQDFLLVEKCLGGDENAIALLQSKFGPDLLTFLTSRGATLEEATEELNLLWADGLVDKPDRPALFASYRGWATFRTWLNTVSFNRLLTRKRGDARREKRVTSLPEPPKTPDGESMPMTHAEGSVPFVMLDTDLMRLMQMGLELALTACSDEDFVLLKLSRRDELHLGELALMWRSNTTKVHRRLEEICAQVARRTLRNIKDIDPWVDLRWEDFLEMCQVAAPGNLA